MARPSHQIKASTDNLSPHYDLTGPAVVLRSCTQINRGCECDAGYERAGRGVREVLNRHMADVHSTPSQTCWIWSPLLVLKSLAPVLRRPGTRLRILKSSSPPPRPNWWPWNGSVPAWAGAVASLTRCCAAVCSG